MYVEPLLTKSKDDSTHSRRVVFGYLKSKEAVTELFREISPKIADRPGGYTRILKTGNRLGDNAEMCIIELVDYNENMLGGGADSKSKGRRRRRGGKKKDEAGVQVTATQDAETTETVETEETSGAEEQTAEEVVENAVETAGDITETDETPIVEEKAETVEEPLAEKVEASASEPSTEDEVKEEPSASATEEPGKGDEDQEKKE